MYRPLILVDLVIGDQDGCPDTHSSNPLPSHGLDEGGGSVGVVSAIVCSGVIATTDQ